MAQTPTKSRTADKPLMQVIVEHVEEFGKVLPSNLPSQKFVRVLKTAISQNQNLLHCDPRALINECQKAAADGLVLDGREATLTIFNVRTKRGNEWETTPTPKYIPMYQGLIKRARNSGELKTISAHLIGHNEATTINPQTGEPYFRYWIDDAGVHVVYTPMLDGNPGKVIGGFSCAVLAGNITDFHWMPRARIDEIKGRTRSRKGDKIVGPWASDEAEMMKKTIIRGHSKTLPMDSDIARVFARDDDLYTPDDGDRTPVKQAGAGAALLSAPDEAAEDGDGGQGSSETAEPAKAEKKQKAKAAPKQEAEEPPTQEIEGTAEEPPHDPETGEVFEGDVI